MIVSWRVHQKLKLNWKVVFIYWYVNAFVIWWTYKYGENTPKLLSLKVLYKFWNDGWVSKIIIQTLFWSENIQILVHRLYFSVCFNNTLNNFSTHCLWEYLFGVSVKKKITVTRDYYSTTIFQSGCHCFFHSNPQIRDPAFIISYLLSNEWA